MFDNMICFHFVSCFSIWRKREFSIIYYTYEQHSLNKKLDYLVIVRKYRLVGKVKELRRWRNWEREEGVARRIHLISYKLPWLCANDINDSPWRYRGLGAGGRLTEARGYRGGQLHTHTHTVIYPFNNSNNNTTSPVMQNKQFFYSARDCTHI